MPIRRQAITCINSDSAQWWMENRFFELQRWCTSLVTSPGTVESEGSRRNGFLTCVLILHSQKAVNSLTLTFLTVPSSWRNRRAAKGSDRGVTMGSWWACGQMEDSLEWRHMSVMASQIADNSTIYQTVCSRWLWIKHLISLLLGLCEGVKSVQVMAWCRTGLLPIIA